MRQTIWVVAGGNTGLLCGRFLFPTRAPSKSMVEFGVDPMERRSSRKRDNGPLRGKSNRWVGVRREFGISGALFFNVDQLCFFVVAKTHK